MEAAFEAERSAIVSEVEHVMIQERQSLQGQLHERERERDRAVNSLKLKLLADEADKEEPSVRERVETPTRAMHSGRLTRSRSRTEPFR